MNQSVENIMAEKAQASMAGFLDFCCQLIEEAQMNGEERIMERCTHFI